MGRHEPYELEPKPLGRGGYAEVFRARHKQTGEVVALKRLRSRDGESVARLRREIEVLRKLQHAHVIGLLDADPSGRWYTMPVAEGSLHSLLKRLDEPERLRALQHAAEGLAFAHSHGYVHRDVTPNNILAFQGKDGERRWVVSDWGLVRRPWGQTSAPLTQGPLGAEGFIAPETWRNGHEARESADVYGLGRVAAWMATGQWPTPNMPLLPEGPWRAFVQSTTAQNPLDRPRSMPQVLELLQALDPKAPPPADLLAWRLDLRGMPRTVWLRPQANGVELLGSRPGLFIAAGERLWAWREQERPLLLPELDDQVELTGFDVRYRGWSEGRLRDAQLVDVLSGNTRLVSSPQPYRYASEEQFERSFRLLGSLGGLLFLAVNEQTYGTYMRLWSRWEFLVLDVATGERVEVLNPEELDEIRRQEQPQALLQFRQTYPEDTDIDIDDADAVTLESYWPRYTGPGGHLSLQLHFTHYTYSAGWDQVWSSGTRSTFLDMKRMPRRLEPFRTMPDALSRHWAAQYPGDVAHGWSAIGANPAVLAWLEEMFRERSPNG
jgi:serine/threonine protein kinase